MSEAFLVRLARYAARPAPRGPLRGAAVVARVAGRAVVSLWRARAFDRPPIVIGGCGRSGTTLLLSMLSAHPGIFAIPVETMALCPAGYRPEPDLEAPFELRRLYRHVLLGRVPRGSRRWCEKTPRNVLYFRRILDHFEQGVRLVHVVRDGRDVVTSRHPQAPSRPWVSPRRWIEDVSAGRRLEGDPRLFTVRYEDLVLDFEPTMRDLCRFLDEPCSEAILHWHEHATVRRSVVVGLGEVEPVHRMSVGRWRRPEHAAIVADLLDDPRAGDLLHHYGYD